jgi:hypothetical protein
MLATCLAESQQLSSRIPVACSEQSATALQAGAGQCGLGLSHIQKTYAGLLMLGSVA